MLITTSDNSVVATQTISIHTDTLVNFDNFDEIVST